MALKEGKPVFSRVLVLSLIMILASTGYFIYKEGNFPKNTTGFSINEFFSNNYFALSFSSKVFLFSEILFLLMVLGFTMYRDAILLKNKAKSLDIHLKADFNKNKTDLDTLYELLKEKKELPISAITKIFKISHEVALEWCKILESGELVTISFPSFSEPIIRIYEKESKNPVLKKADLKKESQIIKEELKVPKKKNDLKQGNKKGNQ
jgi:hypothetical protein